MRKFLTISLIALSMISCGKPNPNEEVDEGSVQGNVYNSSEIGWTIKIPDKWEITDKDKTKAAEQKGKKVMEESAGQEIDVSQLKHLISFKKDRFNLLAATSEPFIEEYPGEFAENNKKINKLIFDAFASQGIKADTLSDNVIIDGLEFFVLKTKLYGPDGNVILNQMLYSRLINGYSFGVTISYNNQEDGDIMLQSLLESEFDKKKP